MPPFGPSSFSSLRPNETFFQIKARVIERTPLREPSMFSAIIEDAANPAFTPLRLELVARGSVALRFDSVLKAGRTYIIRRGKLQLTPVDISAHQRTLLNLTLSLTEETEIEPQDAPTADGVVDGAAPQDSEEVEVQRIRLGLEALHGLRQTQLVTAGQHRRLKRLILEGDSRLAAAIEVHQATRDAADFADTCQRIVGTDDGAPAPTHSATNGSSTASVAAVQFNTTTALSGGFSFPTTQPAPASFAAPPPPTLTVSTASPGGGAFSFGVHSPAGSIAVTSSPVATKFNIGSPSVASPWGTDALANWGAGAFGGFATSPSASKPAPLSPFAPKSAPLSAAGGDSNDVASLLNKVTHRQEAGDDDENHLAIPEIIRQMSGPQPAERMSFPECSLEDFAQLCEAATRVKRLRVLVDKSAQVPPLARLIAASKDLTHLDISHSTFTADDFSAVLAALASSTSVKSLNAEFCKLEDNAAMCAAMGQCLRQNNSLRKINFDGNYLTDNFLIGFSDGLRHNRSLELVHFATNLLITPKGLGALVAALDANTTLKGVHLYANPNLRGSPLLQEMLACLQRNIGRK